MSIVKMIRFKIFCFFMLFISCQNIGSISKTRNIDFEKKEFTQTSTDKRDNIVYGIIEVADQIWFAAASANKERFMIKVTTTLEYEEYPSNANMVERLAEFLESGAHSDAINIFKNVQTSYKESTEKLVYSFNDLNQLISSLESRDKNNIEIMVQQLLQKQ